MKRLLSPEQFSMFRLQFSGPFGTGCWHSINRHSPPAANHCARRTGAFTLIELMVVVAVVAIVAGLALSTLGYVNRKGAMARAQSEVAALSAAIDSYRLEFGAYPSNAATLYADLTGTGTLNKNKVFFEPPPAMVSTSGSTKTFVDPFGQPYNYNAAKPTNNVGAFDLWCVPPGETSQGAWIHN